MLDRELAPHEADEVRAHLETCAECRTELDRLTATVSLLKAMPALAPPRSFRLEAPPARQPLLRFPTWRLPSPIALRGFAGAAAALMVVLFTADALRTGPSPTESPAMPALATAPSVDGGAAAAQFRAGAESRDASDTATQAAPLAARSAPQVGGAPAAAERPEPAAVPAMPFDRSEGAIAPDASPIGRVDDAAPRQVVARESAPTGAVWTPARVGALALAIAAAGLLAASFLTRRAS